MTLRDFLTVHYWPERALSLQPKSLEQIRYSVEAFDRHLGRDATLPDLDRLVVLGFLAARARKVSPATVNKDRRSLLCLWRLAAELEMAKWPTRIPKAKIPQTVPHTFSMDELHRLLDAAAHFRDATFWRSLLLALFDTASRVSAMLSVRIADVNFTDQTIRLRAETTKTLTEQVLPIAQDTAQAIAAQVLGRGRDELVWPWQFHHRRLFIHFRLIAEKAGIALPRGKVFHSLRRTTATMIASDIGIEAACRRLGHSNIATTKRYVDASRMTPQTWLPPRP